MENTKKNTGLQLSDLKVSNLPELQGWKEKQETLVKDNPYIEITDNKTYEIACKSRTALLKGRTELEKQDKLVASKLAAFRKDVKTETDILIAITLPFEEKQQAEVKHFEEIKALEKAEKERIEKERIDGIKAKIESIETESFAIIQKMTFQTIIPDGATIALICKQEFDFEEYDILFEQTLARIENAIKDKIDDLNEREDERVAKEKAEEENRLLKAKQELQAKRLTEIMPYVAFGEAVDLTNLSDIEESVYSEILSSKKALFEADAKEKSEKQEQLDAENLERENKAKADKKKIFEIRKSRLAEIGFEYKEVDSEMRFSHNFYDLYYTKEVLFDCDAIDFETMITDAKLAIEKAKEEHERAEKQKAIDLKLAKEDAERLKKENKARVKRLAKEKNDVAKIIEERFILFRFDLDIDNIEISSFIQDATGRMASLKLELLTELEKL